MLFILFVAFAFSLEVPKIPEDFYSPRTTVSFQGMSITGEYWRSYEAQMEKVVSSFFGVNATAISYFKCKWKYTVESCTKEDLDQEMYSMQIPFWAEYKGKEKIDGYETEHFYAPIPWIEDMDTDYWVYNSSKYGWVIFRFHFKMETQFMPIEMQMDLRDVVPQTFNVEETFIVDRSVCPKAPSLKNLEKCDGDIFPPVKEKVVAFVIDKSGSMSTQVKTKEGTKTRIQVVKEQMENILESVQSSQKFNILPFSDSVAHWMDEPQDATDRNIKAAVKYVNTISPGGGTAIYDSLQFALKQDDVEAVYFLTDGEPSYHTTSEIISMIKKTEEQIGHPVKIHCTNFFGSGEDLLKKIAQETGGIYTNIADGQI